MSVLLRNCRLQHLSGLGVQEGEAEVSSAFSETTKESLTILRVVGGGARVFVDEAVLEGAIDENRDLSCGGGDGFRLAYAISESSEVSAESGLSSAKAHGSHAKDGGGAVGRGLGSGAEQASS